MTTSSSVTAPLETVCGDLLTLRQLHGHERSPAGPAPGVPLVIAPRERSDLAFITDLFREHTDAVKQAIFDHGAILIRGFDIRSSSDFEKLVLGMHGLRPMSAYGSGRSRQLIEGTKHVFDTNSVFKSGGDWGFGGFHSESYYLPDVPHILGFCCLKAPWLGGETGLVHMANAYREFDPELKALLEARPCQVNAIPLDTLAARYKVPEETLERFFQDERGGTVALKRDNGRTWLVVNKPSVYRHPYTNRPSLQVNLSVEVGKVDELALAHFSQAYRSLKWCVHRLAWKHKQFRLLLSYLSHLPRAFRHPELFGSFIMTPLRRWAKRVWQRQPQPQPQQKEPTAPAGLRLKEILEPRHVRALADALWRHSSAFTWQPGDVLLVDNLQMLHAGMPGFGPRVLRVMLCNPLPFPARLDTGVAGFPSIDAIERSRSMHERLVDLSQAGAPRD